MTGDAFWLVPAAELLAELHVGREGLTESEAASRLRRDGPNQIEESGQRHLVADLLRRLGNPLIAILLVAAMIAGFTGDTISFVLIVSMVLLSTILDTVQERRAEATAQALKRAIALTARVRRDGTSHDIPAAEIVCGDVVSLRAGDLVPADGIVLDANAAQVNQAALTGEPYPVEKRAGPVTGADVADAHNALFQGTAMVAGTATLLVTATGTRTRFGAISAALASTPTPTAFERGLHRFGLLIVRLTVFLVLFVLLAHIALGRPPLQTFLFAMALAVGLTPELLPMIMTVGLARGAQRMAKAQVVVKRLSAIHDLGQMDVLCTDKTGTLTEAHIAVVAHPGIDGADDERVIDLAAINARFETGIKSPLDEALLLHTSERPLTAWTKLDERPFDFDRRRVSVLAEAGDTRIEVVKGAPETILSLCRRAEDRSGAIVPLDEALRTRLNALHDAEAQKGLRLLAVAWREAGGKLRIEQDDEHDLIFSGFCVFVDPPKASATAAIAELAAQGVRIKVVSGDAPAVVEHLVSILSLPIGGMLTGAEIDAMSDAALAARVDDTDLFARISPDQKTRIVRALLARGHTVGFLGDGINDAPAIKAADVGLSVEGATDVAREAADMILLSSDLAVLAEGVAEGRRTYANIMKYIRMGTSSNFGNMLTMALASLWLPFLPLTPIQVLINNFFYDMSQIGIPFDDADAEDLGRPHGWNMHALVRFTMIMGPLSTVFDLATFWLLTVHLQVSVDQFRSAWFIESMATQILVVFVIRTMRRPWQSRPHAALLTSALVALSIALTLPFLPIAGPLGFGDLGFAVVALIMALVALYLLSAELSKRFAVAPAATATPVAAPKGR